MPSYAITGAARGIGFEFVRQLSASPENTVFALVRSKSTANKLEALNARNVHILEADIVDVPALKAAATEVAKVTGGSLDYLINNAGVYGTAEGTGVPDAYKDEKALEQDFHYHFDINVLGVIHTINNFLPLLSKSSIKKVIVISSGVGDTDFIRVSESSGWVPYAVSKAAVNMVVAKYAVQYKPEGFVFLALSPGFVNTSVAPPTPHELELFGALVPSFKKYDPTFEGAITPEESVTLQLQVIHRWTVEETGAFVSHHGNQRWL